LHILAPHIDWFILFTATNGASYGLSCADAEELERVDLILPPPARLDAGAAEGALPQATQRALGKLFSACGLSADFVGKEPCAAISNASSAVYSS
jgi:hypothetical protein